MKTQSEIEALLSQWYGPAEMNEVLFMDEGDLWTEHESLGACQPSPNLDAAMDGVWLLLSSKSIPKRECRIDAVKKDV